jgi:hypothetical protein
LKLEEARSGETLANCICKFIESETTRNKLRPIQIAVLNATSAKPLDLIQKGISESFVAGFFKDDSEYLLAERYLKDSDRIQAFSYESLERYFRDGKKFDVTVLLSPAMLQDLSECLKLSMQLECQNGLLVLVLTAETAPDHYCIFSELSLKISSKMSCGQFHLLRLHRRDDSVGTPD